MTIDDRVDDVARKWFTPDPKNNFEGRVAERFAFVDYLRRVLLEVARDQRHACAEAVLDIRDPNLQWKDAAHSAVMNAEIK